MDNKMLINIHHLSLQNKTKIKKKKKNHQNTQQNTTSIIYGDLFWSYQNTQK